MKSENLDNLIPVFGVALIVTKIILFAFAIWRFFHVQLLDAIALVSVGEFLGWVGSNALKEWGKFLKRQSKIDFQDLIFGNTYEIYSSEDDSLIASGELMSITQEGLRLKNYYLPSKDYEKIYIV
ncbi:hypothetical protein [Aulosira sp. FACHB-615]|uniref:hypothetical protein n=1 Tax=Aulosira sp. FACHB-615 TaxID=2692777 RepID=UPI0016878D8F|nr:hypothetical protein [Aulosira sp. FACHB-615]MBD2489025.1 hypothetical protein [Aulosira sp. FACHB-615]